MIFITIISSVLIFVTGQIILKLIIEPWQLQRECFVKISHHLLLYASIFSNPGVREQSETKNALFETRKLASELVAAASIRVPCYNLFSKIKIFHSMEKVIKVKENLIFLSNSQDSLKNGEKIDEMKELLGQNFGE